MTEKDVFLSKTLSWLLRHSAKKEGLPISPEGYVAVDAILTHKSLSGKYTLKDIEYAVNTNAKKRFILRKDPVYRCWQIKACQGHTFPLSDVELTPIIEPQYKTVVHGTYLKAWESIKKQGLSRKARQHIHLAKGTLEDRTVISGLRFNVEIYIFIDLKKALDEGLKFYESENGVILTEGDEEGFLKPKYFLKVVRVDTGYPPYTQAVDLVRTFAKFGTVSVERMHPRGFAVLQCDTAQEAAAAIQASKKVNVYGEFLNVRQYTERDNKPAAPKRDFPRSKQKGVIVEPAQIDLSGDFYTQVDAVLAAIRLTQEQVTAVSALYADLERVLQALWPGCVALPFGSITTGLGIKTSDADCFLAVPRLFHHQQHTFVNKAKRVLQTYPKLFAEILTIPRANTPIVKFFHIPTETNCDLSFKTPLGSQNSKLIAFLLHADPRLIPVAVVIKYWAKVHGLSGTGRLTNYALTMMIIFYLQQPPISILPSVEWLQRDPKYDVIVDYWNTGFMDSKECLPPCSNTSTISELLGGFFEYYASFNFEEMVVSPFLGTPVKKEAFVDITKIPKEFNRYKANVLTKLTLGMRATTSMCVQDPFEQCHNVASAISSKLAADIKAYLKFAANSYDNDKLNGCKDFLKTILLQKPKIIRAKTHPEYRIAIFPKVITNISNPDWNSVVRETVFTIFETCLKLKLTKVDAKANSESKKDKERYMGTITKAIWKRKQFSRIYSVMNLDFAEKQARITEEIMCIEKTVYDLHFQMTLIMKQDTKSAVFAVKLLKGDVEAFQEFGKFYLGAMHSWFSTLLKPRMKPTQDTAKTAETNKMVGNNDNELDSDDDSDDDDAEDDNMSEEVDNDSSDEGTDVNHTGKEVEVSPTEAKCPDNLTNPLIQEVNVANHIEKEDTENKDIQSDLAAKPDTQTNS